MSGIHGIYIGLSSFLNKSHNKGPGKVKGRVKIFRAAFFIPCRPGQPELGIGGLFKSVIVVFFQEILQ